MNELDPARPGWPGVVLWVLAAIVVLLGLAYLLAPEWTSEQVAVGLLATTIVFACLMVGRLVGFVVEGVYAAQLGAFVVESTGVVLSVLGLRSLAARGLADPRGAAFAERR